MLLSSWVLFLTWTPNCCLAWAFYLRKDEDRIKRACNGNNIYCPFLQFLRSIGGKISKVMQKLVVILVHLDQVE